MQFSFAHGSNSNRLYLEHNQGLRKAPEEEPSDPSIPGGSDEFPALLHDSVSDKSLAPVFLVYQNYRRWPRTWSGLNLGLTAIDGMVPGRCFEMTGQDWPDITYRREVDCTKLTRNAKEEWPLAPLAASRSRRTNQRNAGPRAGVRCEWLRVPSH